MESDLLDIIRERVHRGYWDHELNCARVTLMVLAEIHKIHLEDQVLHAAIGMHGAGKFGAQCGVLEGGLMFVGVLGKAHGFQDTDIVSSCYDLANRFESRFGSLLCSTLRPQGFSPDNPPHLCEELTVQGLVFLEEFMSELV